MNAKYLSDAWEAIQGLDGIDDKLLSDPAVIYIPQILDEGELPQAFAKWSSVEILVATDRRIIVLNRSDVRQITSYPYSNIRTFRATFGFLELGLSMVMISGGRQSFGSR